MADTYPSKYSNGKYVSAAQYITELICENKAKRDKEDLHYRFWLSKKWEKYFRNQIASSHKLLQTYSPQAIIGALKSDKAKNTYSLRSPFLKTIIEEQEKVLESKNSSLNISFDRSSDKKFETNKNIKGLLSKLEDIDNEH